MPRPGWRLELPAQQVLEVVVSGTEREIGTFNHRRETAKDKRGISGVGLLNVGSPLSGEFHIHVSECGTTEDLRRIRHAYSVRRR